MKTQIRGDVESPTRPCNLKAMKKQQTPPKCDTTHRRAVWEPKTKEL
jgi:hypothetical protein